MTPRFINHVHIPADPDAIDCRPLHELRERLESERVITPAPETKKHLLEKNADDEWRRLSDETFPAATVSIDADGKIIVVSLSQNVRSGTKLVAAIRKSPSFKEAEQSLRDDLASKVSSLVASGERGLAALTGLHEQAPDLLCASDFQTALEGLVLTKVHPEPFTEPMPTHAEIQEAVSREADERVSTPAIWRLARLRSRYFDEHYWQRYQEAMEAWRDLKTAHDQREATRAEEENRRREAMLAADRETLEKALEGDEEYVTSVVMGWMDGLLLPLACDIDFEFSQPDGELRIDVRCPPVDALPRHGISQSRTGALKAQTVSDVLLRKRYAAWMFSNDVFIAANVCNASPAVSVVTLTNLMPLPDGHGQVAPTPVFSAKIPRDVLEQGRCKSSDPERTLLGCEHRLRMTSGKAMREVEPF